MKKTTITMDGNGILSIPSNLEELWMSEGELVDILYVTAPKLNSVIRAIYKEGMLSSPVTLRRDECLLLKMVVSLTLRLFTVVLTY